VEMRRRVWSVLKRLDVAVSSVMGLPRMIQPGQSDTAEPRNLQDEDFDENTAELPPPRPDTEYSMMLFVRTANAFMALNGEVNDFMTNPMPPSYAKVMDLDKKVNAARAAVPAILQPRPLAESIMDSSDLIIGRIYTAIAHLKPKCVLHRRYMVLGRSDPTYRYSWTSCVESALQILEYHSLLDQETQASGRLYRDRWKMSMIVKADFLLATTILCLEVDRNVNAEAAGEEKKDEMVAGELSKKIVNALRRSNSIWLKSIHTSREARKAAEVIRIVLGKVDELRQNSSQHEISTATNKLLPIGSMGGKHFGLLFV
jgi:hypothetical protein